MSIVKGRPGVGDTVAITIRISDSLRDDLRDAADKAGRSVNTHISMMLSASVSGGKGGVRKAANGVGSDGMPAEVRDRILSLCADGNMSTGVLINRCRTFRREDIVSWVGNLVRDGHIDATQRKGANGKVTTFYRSI